MPRLKPDKLRIVTVKGPLFERAIQDAQRYIARILIKKLDEAERAEREVVTTN
jgi:hypothetical protein